MRTRGLQIISLALTTILAITACASGTASPEASTDNRAKQPDEGQYNLPRPAISAAFPYKSRYLDVMGSRMHYVSEGQGESVVFIHGNPTSAYLWRNIIPFVSATHQAIALDLIGMGKSGKPDIDYNFADHFRYVEAFIKQLHLKNITFVVHDWGAAIGFEYARRHPEKVRAIAFMEGVLPPAFPQSSFQAMGEKMGGFFRTLKDPVKGKAFVIDSNGFVEQLIPAFTNRKLGEAEMSAYRAPFKDKASRKPTLMWPLEIPIGGKPEQTTELLKNIDTYMSRMTIPVLLLYGSPGAIIPPSVVPWYEKKINHLETAYVGQGLHYLQEDQPQAIGSALQDWLRRHPG